MIVRYIDKRIIVLMISTLAIVFLLLFVPYMFKYYEHINTSITSINCKSSDNAIIISWDGYCKDPDELILFVYNEDNLYEKINMDKKLNSYVFESGKHGQMYSFELAIVDSNKNTKKKFHDEALYIVYSKLPNIPIVNINTKYEVEPTCEPIYPPEGYWGISVTNNDYVEGYFSYSMLDGSNFISSEMKIRVRGNTSSQGTKKSYKLKLDGNVDLLFRQEINNKSDEWILLNVGTDLNTCIGNIIASQCREDWQPSFQYVNVIINGDWKGCYILTESVEPNKEGCNISKEGFIIENDPYWWNGSVNWFRTNLQYGPFAYTLKYPKSTAVSEERLEYIKEYLNGIEYMIYNNDESYSDYVDQRSFASWVLAHDILGTSDYAGSNMYMYNYSLNNIDENKLKMGPLWDYGSCLTIEDTWSHIHESEVFYYNQLFSYESFKEIYVDIWNEKKETIVKNSLQQFNDYVVVISSDLQESWDLDAVRYGKSYSSVKEQQEVINQYIINRMQWITQNIDDI